MEVLILKELFYLNIPIEILNFAIRLICAFASYYLFKRLVFVDQKFLHLRFPIAVGFGPLISSAIFALFIKFNLDINILFLKFMADLITSFMVYYFLSRP